MKASHRKGVATHPAPESCVASRKATIEALTGAPVGRVLSCEIIASRVPTSYLVAEGNTAAGVSASLSGTLRSLTRAFQNRPFRGRCRPTSRLHHSSLFEFFEFLQESTCDLHRRRARV